MVNAYPWLLTAHLIAIVLWVSAITTIYWMLRLHDHVSGDSRDKLTLMERSLALSADIALTVALGCGIAMAVAGPGGAMAASWFTQGWLHVKIAAVVLGMLSVHGI